MNNNDFRDEDQNQENSLYTEFFESETDYEFSSAYPNELSERQKRALQEEREEELKRQKRRRLIIVVSLVAAALLLVFYIWGAVYFMSHFFPRTEINGINVGRQTISEANQTMSNSLGERTVTIQGINGVQDTVTGSQIGLSFNNYYGSLEELLHQQHDFLWPFEVFSRKDHDLTTDYTYNENRLNEVINSLPIVSGPEVVAPQNAGIEYNGSEFVIRPAVDGDQPNAQALASAVANALVNNEPVVNLSAQMLYNRPEVTADNPTLNDILNQYNTAITSAITLNFPGEQVVVNKDTFAGWLTVADNQATLNNDNLNAFVSQLAERFDNNGDDITFNASGGGTYYFKYNSGWVLNQQAEADQLKQQILAGTVVTEDPIWSQQGSNFITGTTMGPTYVEVSLARQMIWYYQNNSIVSSSTIVSGDISQGEATTPGLYFIRSKELNVNLYVRQPNGVNGNTQVKYWLPYSDHYGIQCATWRTNFGGDIYRTQGTDGDIDVPEAMASALYNVAQVGTPVVIY